MKIAFVSYEYPPDTACGGIATYVYQAAQLLTRAGCKVEVFAASPERSGFVEEAGVAVHRIRLAPTQRPKFAEMIATTFVNRHNQVGFDVVEGSEIGAETQGIAEKIPSVARVVKLHTPTFLIQQMNQVKPSLKMYLRRYGGALRRGKWPRPFPQLKYNCTQDLERHYTLTADEITTPSSALGEILIEQWGLPRERVATVPNPYVPTPDLLAIPIEEKCCRTVTFVGRLEQRKGILDLAAAIPIVLGQHPDVTFRLIGATGVSPEPPQSMRDYLEKRLRLHRSSLDFTGPLPLTQIPKLLAETSICVFPSLWENFPNVCLEAMAAGRGIVGSRAGGMTEMLDNGRVGRLVAPHNPQQLASAIIELLDQPNLRADLGALARERVLTAYSTEKISQVQIASYQRAIQRHQSTYQVL